MYLYFYLHISLSEIICVCIFLHVFVNIQIIYFIINTFINLKNISYTLYSQAFCKDFRRHNPCDPLCLAGASSLTSHIRVSLLAVWLCQDENRKKLRVYVIQWNSSFSFLSLLSLSFFVFSRFPFSPASFSPLLCSPYLLSPISTPLSLIFFICLRFRYSFFHLSLFSLLFFPLSPFLLNLSFVLKKNSLFFLLSSFFPSPSSFPLCLFWS